MPLLQIESVRTEIETAFGDLLLPSAEEMIAETSGGQEGEKAIKEALQGKTWQELDTAFLKRNWASFGYLSDVAYRYYLPALLVRSLENFRPHNHSLEELEKRNEIWKESHNLSSQELFDRLSDASDDSDLLHSTLYELIPRFYSLYREGRDAWFEYQTSLFSRNQYNAVCSFLGLVFEQIPHYNFDAAKALHWGWNRQENPALETAHAFYEKMNRFVWPGSENPDVRRVIAQIHQGFKDTPYPESLNGNQEEVRDGDDEIAEILWEFRGKNWRTLHPEFLMEYETALSFLPHRAFRYFLPAFLIADLMSQEMESVRNANAAHHLTFGLADERKMPPEHFDFLEEMGWGDHIDLLKPSEIEGGWHAYALERLGDFTAPERAAIVTYLRFSLDQIDELEKEFPEYAGSDYVKQQQLPIRQALERFWLR